MVPVILLFRLFLFIFPDVAQYCNDGMGRSPCKGRWGESCAGEAVVVMMMRMISTCCSCWGRGMIEWWWSKCCLGERRSGVSWRGQCAAVPLPPKPPTQGRFFLFFLLFFFLFFFFFIFQKGTRGDSGRRRWGMCIPRQCSFAAIRWRGELRRRKALALI